MRDIYLMMIVGFGALALMLAWVTIDHNAGKDRP